MLEEAKDHVRNQADKNRELKTELAEVEAENAKLKEGLKRVSEYNGRLDRKLAEVEAENAKLREVEKYARIFVDDSYRPAPKYDAMRYDDLKQALAALLEGK